MGTLFVTKQVCKCDKSGNTFVQVKLVNNFELLNAYKVGNVAKYDELYGQIVYGHIPYCAIVLAASLT